MAKENGTTSENDPFNAPNPAALELTVAAGALGTGANAKTAVNAILIEEPKDGVR